MNRTLNKDIKAFAEQHRGGWEFFQSRSQGSFDFRASVVT
jgi:hypothetical protein